MLQFCYGGWFGLVGGLGLVLFYFMWGGGGFGAWLGAGCPCRRLLCLALGVVLLVVAPSEPSAASSALSALQG